jgi:hypothetical protein
LLNLPSIDTCLQEATESDGDGLDPGDVTDSADDISSADDLGSDSEGGNLKRHFQ